MAGKEKKYGALPAIRLAETLMLIIFRSELEPKDCIKAQRALSTYEAGEGTLWGIMDLAKHDRMDGRFYSLKGVVVDFIHKLQTHEDYYLIAGLEMMSQRVDVP